MSSRGPGPPEASQRGAGGSWARCGGAEGGRDLVQVGCWMGKTGPRPTAPDRWAPAGSSVDTVPGRGWDHVSSPSTSSGPGLELSPRVCCPSHLPLLKLYSPHPPSLPSSSCSPHPPCLQVPPSPMLAHTHGSLTQETLLRLALVLAPRGCRNDCASGDTEARSQHCARPGNA